MERLKREDIEMLSKDSIVEKFMQMQELFFSAMDTLKPIQDFAERYEH